MTFTSISAFVRREKKVKTSLEHTKKSKKGHFQWRISLFLSLFVIVPCLLMALLSSWFLKNVLNVWLDEKVQTVLTQAKRIGQIYVTEQEQNLRFIGQTMAQGLERHWHAYYKEQGKTPSGSEPKNKDTTTPEAAFFQKNHDVLKRDLYFFSALLNVDMAIITLDRPIERCGLMCPVIVALSSFRVDLRQSVKTIDLTMAKKHGFFSFFSPQQESLMALIPLPIGSAYLVLQKPLEPKLMACGNSSLQAGHDYGVLLAQKERLILRFALAFLVLSLVMIMAAIGFGLRGARRFISPIRALLEAAERTQGDALTPISLEKVPAMKELRALMITFNHMIQRLKNYQGQLNQAHKALQERTLILEGVLQGVSCGVMNLGPDGLILSGNKRAQEILRHSDVLEGQFLGHIMPSAVALLEKACKHAPCLVHQQVEQDFFGESTTLRIHMKAHTFHTDAHESIIMTFDDISAVLAAEKKTAWIEMAHRAAHEIKNPLTPIILSAQRLQRRLLTGALRGRGPGTSSRSLAGPLGMSAASSFFGAQEEKEIVLDCIETIIRQTQHIGRLVSQFSAFGRLPQFQSSRIPLLSLLRQIIALQQEAYPDITYVFSATGRKDSLENTSGGAPELWIHCDSNQIEQVTINLLKNATESVQERRKKDASATYLPRIALTVRHAGAAVYIHIQDNGLGLTGQIKPRLPYISTKAHGVGLGLTIVQNILRDHGGIFALRPWGHGALASFSLPVNQKQGALSTPASKPSS